jgi:ribosomal protein S20
LVISDLKKAIERNNERERSLHPNTIRSMYKQVEDNLKYSAYQTLFKNNYVYINNNTETSIKDLTKMIISNFPAKDGVDKYNRRVLAKILNWINRSTEQSSMNVSKMLSDYLINKKQQSKFKTSIKKIKESYQFRV